MGNNIANNLKPPPLNSLLHLDEKSLPKVMDEMHPDLSVFNKSKHISALVANAFPHPPKNGSQLLLGTIENTIFLLDGYGIKVSYNVINKNHSIIIPYAEGTNASTGLAYIYSLANLNGLPTAQIANFIEVIGDMNQINPVQSWILSKSWDGRDRLELFYATLTHHPDFPKHLKTTLMYRWALSAVAAALKPNGFKARGVLTLQGSQSMGKTSWISALIPNDLLREAFIKLDHHLDASNKDSIITAVSHWIVEIGELDSSFKKDIARLKGFLTADYDKLRRPYGKADSEYPRRTVFCATVNEHEFLIDSTGNSRFWTIPVTEINYNHGIDMQQLFAQLAIDFSNNQQWWLTKDEEALLELHNKDHRVTSVIRERVLDVLDLARINENGLEAMSPSQLLQRLQFKFPTNQQMRECGGVLREFLGSPKKIQGYMKWRVPFKNSPQITSISDSDLY
ncbi:MAG: VapE family protein [Methylotenera sp.]|uniref:VapE domain-containing protein n=1 Tax=Methylotenera sp. TaxID=2051956 RepID=UPI0024894E6B|nr:VapE domain-containing protein [Methylotenera sp.]MDI1308615.1 VapE family protein [Methylotenera sp.]